MIGRVTLKKGAFPQKGDLLTVLTFENELKKNTILDSLDASSKKRLAEKIKIYEFSGKRGELLSLENLGTYGRTVLIGMGKRTTLTPAVLRNAIATVVRKARSARVIDIDLFLENDEISAETVKNLGLSLHLANYSFIKYKGEKEKKRNHTIRELRLFAPVKTSDSVVKEAQKGAMLAEMLAEGVYLTRDMVNEPASHLGVKHMVEVAKLIEKESKGSIKVAVLEEAECRKLGMGAYLGVAQGSDQEANFIVLQTKSNRSSKTKKIAIIGKSIVFDSGGLSLKPSQSMEDMKLDMAGGAAVLGLFKILAQDPNLRNELTKKVDIFGVVPACENMPSGKALRPGDIVKALNGKTIEVLNTDAEGRLALADAISYAEKHLNADYIVDIATLTGACMVALGADLAGLFSNDREVRKIFQKAARNAGEEVWPLPLHKAYSKLMKSDIADLKNIGGKYGGAITAALFLAEFVSKAKWIHVDIAGPSFRHEGERGVLPKGATGWGVLTLVEFLKSLII